VENGFDQKRERKKEDKARWGTERRRNTETMRGLMNAEN
jgi:hypothetical protein